MTLRTQFTLPGVIMLRKYRAPLALLLLLGSGLIAGCGSNGPVQPPPAEPVPADAPMTEEKPSTDEK
jgi:predicted small lipoprotein YifL